MGDQIVAAIVLDSAFGAAGGRLVACWPDRCDRRAVPAASQAVAAHREAGKALRSSFSLHTALSPEIFSGK